jgi:hypothetical protein
MTEFNHIHHQETGDWICGRTMAFEDRELIHCEARDLEEREACRRCAEQLLGYFGRATYLQ